MLPVGVFVFGNAFTMPAMTTASLAAYPHMAGAAASMNGFFQMGGGLVGGIAAAIVGDPVTAMATVIPVMGVDRDPVMAVVADAAGADDPGAALSRANGRLNPRSVSSGRSKSPVSRFITHELAGRDVEPGAVERQPSLAFKNADAGKGPEIGERIADRRCVRAPSGARWRVISVLPDTVFGGRRRSGSSICR